MTYKGEVVVNIKAELNNNSVSHPIVFRNLSLIKEWKFTSTTPESLCRILNDKKLKFRTGSMDRNVSGVQWEGDCRFISASMKEFYSWVNASKSCGEFKNVDRANCWCYADYIYMRDLFEDIPGFDLNDQLKWSNLGFDEKEGLDSAIWLGTNGSHTPCHYDTYGYNLVVQVYGRKRWILFPPKDTDNLYPTRLPYEESSVFSKVNILNPDIKKYPKFSRSHPHVVILNPGDVLYVPQHWWHFVENLELSISVNAWFSSVNDPQHRLTEAITRLLIGANMGRRESTLDDDWLNPTETMTSLDENMNFLKAALEQSFTSIGEERSSMDQSEMEKRDCGCIIHIPDPIWNAVGGNRVNCYCFNHGKELVEFWSNISVTDMSSSQEIGLDRNVISSLTFRDFMECLSSPRVVSCLSKELSNFVKTS